MLLLHSTLQHYHTHDACSLHKNQTDAWWSPCPWAPSPCVLLQALQFLVFDSKGALSLEDLTEHVCPALNHQQLYRLCTTAWSEEAPGDAPGGPQGKMHGHSVGK